MRSEIEAMQFQSTELSGKPDLSPAAAQDLLPCPASPEEAGIFYAQTQERDAAPRRSPCLGLGYRLAPPEPSNQGMTIGGV